MTDPILPTGKKIRHEDGIVEIYSRRLRRMSWGFDVRIGDHRFRKIGFRERADAEGELSKLRLKEKCERLGLPIDEETLNAKVLWDEVERSAASKLGAIGAACELLVAADLLRRGFDVYRALASNSDSDLIILRGNVCARVEVKSAITKRGCTRFNRSTFDKKRHDILALVFLREFRIEYRPDPLLLFKKYEVEAVSVSDS